MSAPIQSDRLGGTDYTPLLPGEGASETGKTGGAGKVSSGVLTNAEGVTVSGNGTVDTQGATRQPHRLETPSSSIRPNSLPLAQEEVEDLASDFLPPDQRQTKPKRSPLIPLGTLSGEQSAEELETESAGGLQKRLDNNQDKGQLRKTATGGKNEEETTIFRDHVNRNNGSESKTANGTNGQNREETTIFRDHVNRTKDPVVFDISNEEAYVDVYDVMALMHKWANTNRRMSKESRAINHESAKNEVLNQAKEILAGAESRFAAALATSIGQIVAAGASLGALKGGGDIAATQAAGAKASAVSNAITGGSGVVAAAFNLEGGKHDAKVKEHEAFQKTYDNAAQAESEFMNSMQDLIRNLQSSMAEIIRAKHETEKSIIRS